MRAEQHTVDPAPGVVANLKEIHRVFETADEMYRRFRADFPKDKAKIPIQWIPITNQ
jgi:hypothetical protein